LRGKFDCSKSVSIFSQVAGFWSLPGRLPNLRAT